MSSNAYRATFECFGLTVEVLSEDPRIGELMPGVMSMWQQVDDETPGSVSVELTAAWEISVDGVRMAKVENLRRGAIAVGFAARRLVTLLAPDHIFIHAGVVALDGRAIVIPGRSHTGKTTLVSELVRAGATYYSDEFAVVDRGGMIHAYPRIVIPRLDPATRRPRTPGLAASPLDRPPAAESAMVLVTRYSADAVWSPTPLSRAAAVLALFDNCLAAQSRPVEALTAARSVAQAPIRLGGPRGDVGALVPLLLEQLGRG
jgi:hypothetical protein